MAVVALAFAAGPASAATTVNCPGDDLQTAIDNAPFGGTIIVNGHCYGNFEIDGGNGTNSGHITIVGGSSLTTLDGQGNASVLDIFGGATPTIQNLRIVNGHDDEGGGVDVGDCNTSVNLVAVTISGNSTNEGNGGGVYDQCGTLNVTNSLIRFNWAYNDGGGIGASEDARVTVIGTTIRDNVADDGGGANFSNAIVSMTASSIINNVAEGHGEEPDGRGGGIRADMSNVLLTSTKVSTNKVSSDVSGFYRRHGGGIFFDGNYVRFEDAPIIVSPTTGSGGAGGRAVTLVPDGLTLVNSSVDHNVTQHGDGGGIWAVSNFEDSTVTLDSSTVGFNVSSQGSGGGIANIGVCGNTASVLATGSTFQGNQARNGDGGAFFNHGTNDGDCVDPGTALATVAKSPVANGPSVVNQNQANRGGGFANEQDDGVASLSLQPGAKVSGNKAATTGGGVYNDCGSFSSLGQIMLNAPNNVTNNTLCF